MSFENASEGTQRNLAFLNYLYMLAMMTVITVILGAAMVMQYAFGELPCPLCLLERVAMFGVAFAMLLQFRTGFSYRNTGLALLFALLLVIIAERQSLLDIYPRPGHAYIGSAVFGLHLPVWSAIIGLVLLFANSIKLAVIGGDARLEQISVSTFPNLRRIATIVGVVVIALAAINLVSVIVQCGLGECHTGGYKLLGFVEPPAAS